MRRKYNLFFVVLVFNLIFNTNLNAQCPGIGDILNHGYNGGPNPVSGNFDEIGIVHNIPFYTKVSNYPPVLSFPKIPSCSTNIVYYSSFDTEQYVNDGPYKVTLPYHNWHEIKVFDENGVGNKLSIYPPTGSDFGTGSPDLIMKYDGTKHALAWDENQYPDWSWENFVTPAQPYSATFHVEIEGLTELNYNSTFEYIANINGGHGEYAIKWKYRSLPNGSWNVLKVNALPINYFNININGTTHIVYFYDNEHKYNFTMGDKSIELKVTVEDLITKEEKIDIITIHPAPVEFTFNNKIEENLSTGKLVLDENEEINSGGSIDLHFGNNHTIRTNELPFIYNWNGTGLIKKHKFWIDDFSNTHYNLNNSFLVQPTTSVVHNSTFDNTKQAILRNILDGITVGGGKVKFKDPWLYYEDQNGNWLQSNDFIEYNANFELFNNSINSYGGVFLNQGSPNWTPPYYSVKTVSPQTININGNNHKFYFQNWSGTSVDFQNADNLTTGVVFTNANEAVNANLKGNLVSNTQNAISSNSQKKVAKTSDGTLHMVYESMNQIWYTKSTDNISLTYNKYLSMFAEAS